MCDLEAYIFHEIEYGPRLQRVHLVIIVQEHGMLIPYLRQRLKLPLTLRFVQLVYNIVHDLLGL